MNKTQFAIVGSTGKTGARVLDGLQKLGHSPRPLSRNTDIQFDWADKATWAPSLAGIDSAYVTYFPDLAVPQAEGDIKHFVEVAKKQGVQHIVLLSGRGEDGAERAEKIIQNSGLAWNVVRASWFMQNFSESFMLDGLNSGEFILPEPKATEPFIDVKDIADVAVAALTQSSSRNQLLEVTGPELLSFQYCVDVISATSQRQINFITLPVADYIAAATAEGLDKNMAWLINELFTNVLDGRNENTTNTVDRVLGRAATSFKQYVENAAKTGVWTKSGSERAHA